MVAWVAIRTALLVVGWPVLILAGGWMVRQTWRFRRPLGGRKAASLVLQSVVAWLAASVLLGLAITAFMFLDPVRGVQVGVPAFVAWLVSMGVMLNVSRGWASEARHIEAYYEGQEATDRLKASIINRFSHAFATPLTPMANEIALLRGGHLGELNDRQKRALDMLVRNQHRLKQVVDEAVLAGEVHGRRIPLAYESIDVAALVHKAVSNVMGEGDRRIHVEGLPSMKVEADADRMEYVFTQILRHAVAAPSGAVTVRGQEYRHEVEVVIRYPSEEDPVAVFGLFAQDAEFESGSALELGLFTAQGLIELHGGEIQVGRDDADVVLALRLPVAPPQLAKMPALASKA